MENDLHQAFYGVFCSSKEIIKNNQRHLYVNMLDLLARTCKTTGLAENAIGIDSLVEFWIGDLLPLVFDRDASIQNCAVNTMEKGLALMEPSKIHESKHWPQLRQMFISEFPDKIHKLREAKNAHWQKIWCFVIQILDREILKGATIINSFLSVVELGFRSADSNVRAEAFCCWRLLIKIFASYDELLTPKRLKLICIPLKSSQSKSSHSANVKIRVWWYFITCIGKKLGDHFETAVEPFLTFIFGASNRDSGAIHQYNSIQSIAILCLAQLLMEDRDEFVERSVNDHNLEYLEPPSPLISGDVLTKQWQPIINATLAAVRLLCSNSDDVDSYELNQHLLNMLLTRLMKTMTRLNLAICSKSVSDGLLRMLPTETLPLKTALSYLAANGLVLESLTGNLDNYQASLESILALLIAGKSFVPPAILHRCIEQINKTPQSFQGEQNQWKALCAIIKVVCCSTDKDDYAAFETRIQCWRNLSQTILGYLRDNNLSYRRKDFSETVNEFILWPLRHWSTFAGSCQMQCFDDDFCASWRQLLLSGQNAPDREQFLQDIKNLLREFIANYRKELPLAELIDAYVAAMLKLYTGKDNTYIKDIFSVLQEVIALPQTAGSKSFEQYLNTFRNVLVHLKNHELVSSIDLIKAIIAQVVSVTMKAKPASMKFFDDWKQGILERFRTHPQKNLMTQIKEVFKKSDVFVIIPSVWMLNPDKLTERQKERLAERSDIPALYNDMSQSQDSSIKPWTPKKIVIAKQNETEIVIGAGEADDQENLSSKKRADDITEVEKRTLRSTNSKALESPEDGKNLRSAKFSPQKNKVDKEDKEEPKIAAITETPIRTRKSLRSQKSDETEQKQEQTPTASIDTRSTGKSKQIVKDPATKRDAKRSQDPAPTESYAQKGESTESPISSKRTCHKEIQLQETEVQSTLAPSAGSPTEEIILETQTGGMTEASEIIIIESESEKQTDPETESNSHAATIENVPNPRECSPKKMTTRIAPLSSPPDRRSTNNTCSPSLRPKPTPHLTGRGAQLIQMIRSKMKVDSPAGSSSPLGASRSSIILARAEKRESTPVPESMFEPGTNEHTSTPVQSELLTFTKRLPSPSASPSASILKRKLRCESFDETPIESPASKRKKVSFHDPPVSVTKEYLKDIDENNIKPKRCLALDKIGVGKTFEIKHALKRRSKLDSMVEIESFANEQADKEEQTEALHVPSTRSAAKSVMLPRERGNSESLSLPIETVQKQTESLPSAETALEVVVQMCPLETVLDKYFSAENPTSSKATDTLAKFMSKCMSSNARVKSSVLEVLSENHSKDFLDHAVQENLSSVVCDRLNLNSVIEYICAKSKLNTSCLRSLLTEIPEVLKHSKTDGEPINFIKSLIEALNPNDATILDLIAMLMRIRNERQSSSQSSLELESTDVSSSNL